MGLELLAWRLGLVCLFLLKLGQRCSTPGSVESQQVTWKYTFP